MSLGSGKQKALLGAGLQPAGRAGVCKNWPRDTARLLCPGGSGAGRGGRLAGLGMLPRAGVFPPTSLGVTLAGVRSPRAIARPP